MEEVAEVFREERRDGAQRRGADDHQLRPAEEEGGEGAERLEDEGEDPARTGHRRRQLGVGQRAEEGEEAAQHPDQDEGSGRLQLGGHPGRDAEDAAPDGRADEHRHGAPETQIAGEALAPGVAVSGHRPNLARGTPGGQGRGRLRMPRCHDRGPPLPSLRSGQAGAASGACMTRSRPRRRRGPRSPIAWSDQPAISARPWPASRRVHQNVPGTRFDPRLIHQPAVEVLSLPDRARTPEVPGQPVR